MFFYVYVLWSRSRSRFYIGYTHNLKKRFEEHNLGKVCSTKYGIPWQIIYYEASREKTDAIRREGYLKTSQGFRLLRRRLKDDFFRNRMDGI